MSQPPLAREKSTTQIMVGSGDVRAPQLGSFNGRSQEQLSQLMQANKAAPAAMPRVALQMAREIIKASDAGQRSFVYAEYDADADLVLHAELHPATSIDDDRIGLMPSTPMLSSLRLMSSKRRLQRTPNASPRMMPMQMLLQVTNSPAS